MVRYKKGQRRRTADMWEKAGGRNKIIETFMRYHISKIDVQADVWTLLTIDLFQTAPKKYRDWLKIIWSQDRRGVQTAVLRADQTKEQAKESQGKGNTHSKKDEEEKTHSGDTTPEEEYSTVHDEDVQENIQTHGVKTVKTSHKKTKEQAKKSHGKGNTHSKKDEEEKTHTGDTTPEEEYSTVHDEDAQENIQTHGVKTVKTSHKKTKELAKKSHGKGNTHSKKDQEEKTHTGDTTPEEEYSTVHDEEVQENIQTHGVKTVKTSHKKTKEQAKKSQGKGNTHSKKDEEEKTHTGDTTPEEEYSTVHDEDVQENIQTHGVKTVKTSHKKTKELAKKSHGKGNTHSKKDQEEKTHTGDTTPEEEYSTVHDEDVQENIQTHGVKTVKTSHKKTKEQAKKSHGKGNTHSKKDQEEKTHTGDTAAEEGDTSVDNEGAQDEEIEYRQCKPGRKIFQIFITKKKWNKIKPKHDMNKLRSPWTDTLYDEFLKENPCCTLVFKYQHVKKRHSHKKKNLYFNAKAKCTFDECEAVYLFSRKNKPKSTESKISFQVTRVGAVTHKKKQRRFRPAKYLRRGKIAKAITKGVSNFHYAMLKNTPVDQIIAGNITRSMTKDVIKKISSEVRKSSRLHNDVMLELMLTQKVIRESSSHASFKGYLQHLQIDPFALHLYTEGGLNILTEHLKKTSSVTLYLDATGSVVQKIPDQNKKVLYYALVLPGMGKDSPPLPVTELVSNSHSVPAISHWLMEFKRKLSNKTKKIIAQVETDHSWAMINSVLIAFNKENVSVYLDRAYEIGMGQTKEIPTFTVLHLCSAHILKAVLQALVKKTTDKGIKEYALYTFAYLLNCTSMKMAVEIFYHMCVLFDSEEATQVVNHSKGYLDVCVFENKGLKVEESDQMMEGEKITMDKSANTIIGKSPFTQVFQLQRDQAECDVLSDDASGTKNQYHCSGVIDVLLKNYMGIYPLWSGLLLGDLSRHMNIEIKISDEKPKTRDTNCHVELWFSLVKHSILQKKRYLRPAEFVSKMYASMQGRYIEHIMQQNFPEHILDKLNSSSGRSNDDPVEHWNKRDSSAGRSKSKSKYFTLPKKLTKPKSNMKAVKQDHGEKDAQLTLLWKKRDSEVVVAVIPSQMKGQNLLIHHSELCTLRPHQWLIGEVIEGLLHVFAHTFGVMDTIYLMSHYTAGCILFGDRKKLPQQSLRKVDFSNFGAVLSFVLVNNNHWNLLYMHAETSKVYLVDPAQNTSELKASEAAAKRIRQYFVMRRTCHGKAEWVDVKWKGGVMSHSVQQDGSSCGVIVVKMGKALMKAFPRIPGMTFSTSKKDMKKERRELALQLLESSVFDDQNMCAMCATFKPPRPGAAIIQWIQCDDCDRWFHGSCVSLESKDVEDAKEKRWACVLCQ